MIYLSPQYVAGFFDGEGCVNITVRGPARQASFRQASLRVMITNTDPIILDVLNLQYGGFVPRPRINKPGWKPFRTLVLVGRAAIRLLEDIAPFVIVKRPQIELALEFWRFQQLPRTVRCDVIRLGAVRQRGRRPFQVTMKAETIQKELEFKAKMHLLNKKGA